METTRIDLDFEEYSIEQVELKRTPGASDTWVCTLEYGFQVTYERGGGKPQPRPGYTCRVYGDVGGKWGPRGVLVFPRDTEIVGNMDCGNMNERCAYFRTPEEQVEWVVEAEAKEFGVREKNFRARQAEIYLRRDKLPHDLRDDLIAQRNEAADAERWDVLHLEEVVSVCEHVHRLVLVIDDVPTLETFSLIPTQSKMGTVWQTMAEDRRAVISKMLQQDSLSPEQRQKLEEDHDALRCYEETPFYIRHESDALAAIFEKAEELLSRRSAAA